ncbi:hypothetical protein DFR29_10737 [Tahibacter aquaticus]|uniref:Uncharacterized protein n=1 Tax=Tahibacter aquaticus TaxID=520092 RepID=A0A4R6YW49_9GAMM|nr:hypothetical protein [Tahibacter aquaticus]TDR43033.1 hypothetical protein DFR29_10737 [Tahibacter aquaticus]
MKYCGGRPVLLGDTVDLGGGDTGSVVAVIDQGKFSSRYPMNEWSYLSIGALVESSKYGLIHYSGSEHDFELMERTK